jgi:hypothetical protein
VEVDMKKVERACARIPRRERRAWMRMLAEQVREGLVEIMGPPEYRVRLRKWSIPPQTFADPVSGLTLTFAVGEDMTLHIEGPIPHGNRDLHFMQNEPGLCGAGTWVDEPNPEKVAALTDLIDRNSPEIQEFLAEQGDDVKMGPELVERLLTWRRKTKE